MQLPDDIYEYLGKFLKPKIYSLLNKFCRDIYFRENGVSIVFSPKLRHTELYRKYRIRAIKKDYTTDDIIKKYGENKMLRENITYIKIKDCIRAEEYNIIRNLFPNLVKFKCTIDDACMNIITQTALDGTNIMADISNNNNKLHRLIDLGYKISVCQFLYIEYDEKIKNSTTEYIIDTSPLMDFDIGKYPNLKKLVTSYNISEKIIQDITDHPNINKIIWKNNLIPHTIIKKNGYLVSNITYWYTIESDISVSKYETIKNITLKWYLKHQLTPSLGMKNRQKYQKK